jgi:antitoxin component YwqK of YwqJK toxin-antitoxin module
MTVYFENDKEHGGCKQYHMNGNLFREVTFENGLKVGTEKTYYDTEELAAICHYVGGQKEGDYREWKRDGTLIFEGEYKEGKRHGIFNKYYDNGKPRVLQTYLEDNLNGVKKLFDKEGNITEIQYEMGKRI